MNTQRLLLRPFQTSDLEELSPILTDPQVMAFIGDGPLSSSEIKEQLQQWIHDFQRDGFGFMAFIEKASGKLIGYGGFLHQSVKDQSYIELGYVIAKPYWKKGFAFEAANALKNYALYSLKLPEIISIIHEKNIPSQKLASKLGMPLKEKIQIDGEPCLIYSTRDSRVEV